MASVYRAKHFLLTRAELHFFQSLRVAVSSEVLIAIKVRLADVVGCRSERPRLSTLRRISQKHLDFVLYRTCDSRMLAAIELDDRSHERPERAKRDVFVNRLLASAGVPLIRVQTERKYRITRLKQLITFATLEGRSNSPHSATDADTHPVLVTQKRRGKVQRRWQHSRKAKQVIPFDKQ